MTEPKEHTVQDVFDDERKNDNRIEEIKEEIEGRGKIFQNMASDSIKSHFKMLDAQNKLPPDCVKRVLRVDLTPYYYNKKNHERTWDNPRLLIDGHDKDFSDSDGDEINDDSQETHNIVKRGRGEKNKKKNKKTKKKQETKTRNKKNDKI